MRILVTNDDGIRAEGLWAMVRAAQSLGEVKVVAPDRQRSACGHGMTLYTPLRVTRADQQGVQAFEVDGVPVDCVNVGLTVAWPDGCDLVLSGINNGPNLGFDVTYSGTVAAAIEGVINGIRSVAASMALFVGGAPLHFETGERWLRENLGMLLDLPHDEMSLLNVNIPAVAYPEIQGHRFVPMGRRVYQDRVIERTDPWGRAYYWQGGALVDQREQPGTDVEAVNQGYVSITPVRVDWTDQRLLTEIQKAAHAPVTAGE